MGYTRVQNDASKSGGLTDIHGQILLLIVLSGIVGLWRSVVGPELPVFAINALRKRASFGNKNGNFQPSRSDDGEVEDQVIDVLAVEDIKEQDGVGAGVDTYILYTGNGTVDQGWPNTDEWASFEDLWDVNLDIIKTSCQLIYATAANSQGELGKLGSAIDTIAKETLLDHRFIFAVVMQESGGCVRVPTSYYGVRNPGLMQSHNGNATCNEGWSVLYPCPTEIVQEMIREGAAGTNDGDGLVQCLNDSGAEDVSAYYRAARCYNSGAVAESGLLEEGGATHCYASDIANGLTGWAEAERAR